MAGTSLGWKRPSKYAVNVYYAEGNGGTFSNINIKPDEFRRLSLFAKEHECFTIVGPEIPLANGIVDLFTEENLPIFGPTGHSHYWNRARVMQSTL